MSIAVSVRFIRPEQAEGRTKDLYDEIRDTLGISWVPDMFQAFAAHPRYLEVAWRELRALVGRAGFERAADDVRRIGHEAIGRFPPADHVDLLRSQRFAGDFAEIRRVVEAFDHTDPRLLVMATALHDAFQRKPVGTSSSLDAAQRVTVPAFRDQMTFVHPSEAEGPARSILEEIRQDEELSFVAQDYQALARWPDYLDLAYHDLKPHVGTPEHTRAVLEIRNRAGVAMGELPGPIYLDPDDVNRVLDSAEMPRVRALVGLFHDLMPGLVLNLAFFHTGLQRYPSPPESTTP